MSPTTNLFNTSSSPFDSSLWPIEITSLRKSFQMLIRTCTQWKRLWDTTRQNSCLTKEIPMLVKIVFDQKAVQTKQNKIHSDLLWTYSLHINSPHNNTETYLSLYQLQDNLSIISTSILWPSCHSDYSNPFWLTPRVWTSLTLPYINLSWFPHHFFHERQHPNNIPSLSPCRTNNHFLLYFPK